MTLRLNGSTSGYTEIDAPAVAGSNTLKLPTGNGTDGQILGTDGAGNLSWVNGRMVLATAQNTTSGTAIDFTGIPSWVKRITVIFSEVSTTGASAPQLQLGAGSVTTTGYNGNVFNTNGSAKNVIASGHPIYSAAGVGGLSHIGHAVLTLLSGNTWIGSGVTYNASGVGEHCLHTSRVTLSGTLDRIRLTTVNGTDTFDAGSINILYEG